MEEEDEDDIDDEDGDVSVLGSKMPGKKNSKKNRFYRMTHLRQTDQTEMKSLIKNLGKHRVKDESDGRRNH
jgi:hypothetical protein